ncbi:hypothetical protein GR160_08635 [Flavobacterium sp. Sd200]|uniref:hypothetical protein n=1 Tax=Flavobacterium sp. Sd200 TaxID=2692211 RepID=UPI001369D309|nr:hypothetical protein [Flavobacterium sp. Sd200]MXN91294.1 hypothetical protein [Flavobacterium sp. Sd200]
MTRYETITALGDNFIKLMGKSLVPVHLLDWKVYYEAYLKELECQKKYFKKVRKTAVVATVADNYNISERSMFNVIAFMEGC